MNNINLPVLAENDLTRYMADVSKFPMLTKEEEIELANKWIEDEDVEAAHKMVTSHLRLVVKIASGFKGYGLPVNELVQEGNIGLMKAVKRFDPEKGFRLSTYSMWWIKAAIYEYVLRSWSLVKMGTSAAQKKLFFNLRKIKGHILASEDRELMPEEIKMIAHELDVPERDVVEMDQRMSGSDFSLNARFGNDEDSGAEWIDYLEDENDSQEVIVAENQELMQRRAVMDEAMATLNEREKDIITKRRLMDKPVTLDELSKIYDISRERVRQIEARAVEKMQSIAQESFAAS